MKKDQFKGNVGKRVLLRPSAIGAAADGRDDEWLVSSADDRVEVTNLRTNHCAVFGFDAVYSFMSDPAREAGDGVKCGFLQLLVQVEIGDESQVRIEPLPFMRGGSASDGVNLLRLELRKVVAEARLGLDEVVELIRKCHQSRLAVSAANGVARSGAMEVFKKNCAADAQQLGELKRSLPSETQNFSALTAPELETQLVEVYRTQKRATQVRERYARQLALDDERRRELRARAEAQLERVRGGHS